MTPETENPQAAKNAYPDKPARLIRVDTLRIVEYIYTLFNTMLITLFRERGKSDIKDKSNIFSTPFILLELNQLIYNYKIYETLDMRQVILYKQI